MLQEKVALITGASKGIGKAVAYALGKEGAKVILVSRNQEALDEVAKEFEADGIVSLAVAANTGKEEDLALLVEKVVSAFGRIDILVNNAASNPVFGPIEMTDEKAFDKIMDVNVKGPFILSKLVLPYLQKNGGGSIINISSVEGKRPSKGLGVYSVSKSALIQLTKSMALEWGQYNVRVNAICPGLIQTKFSEALWANEKILKHVLAGVPLGRVGQPEEMAGLVVLLASEKGSYITGSIIDADGGYLI
jgi:NAD(P)-dependent dehydrogenase (short-subunit alcohol dehydrogenase family)